MAGHSKWANTKFRKAAQDQKRGKLFTRFIREITIATKQGGPDPNLNPRLRTAIDKALTGNLTRDAIDRAIKRVVGGEEKDLEECNYEGYAPFGIAVMVACLTDNHVRTVSNVRHAFTKHGGNLGIDGSVSYLFNKEGQIFLPQQPKLSSQQQIDDLIEVVINLGAVDFEVQTETDTNANANAEIIITTEPKDLSSITTAITELGFNIGSSEITTVASNYIKPETKEAASQILKFLDSLEDLDDVQNVYSNAELSEYNYEDDE